MNTTETMRSLAAIGSPAPLSVFVWIAAAGQPVRQAWLETMTQLSDKTVAAALERLDNLAYIVKVSGGWMLAPGRQGILGEVMQALAGPDPAPLQAGVPLGGASAQDEDGNSVFHVAGPAQLQAEVPPGDVPAQEKDGNSVFSNSDVVIVLKDSDIKESIKTTITPAQTKDGNSVFPKPRRGAAHIADVTRSLLRKGAPRPADDDPFPPDLRVAVERLVASVHVARKRAEQAVARSPWPADKILEQAAIWLAYALSPRGANLDAAKFPWLVAARIEAGEECPYDTRAASGADDRYDGYIHRDDAQQEST